MQSRLIKVSIAGETYYGRFEERDGVIEVRHMDYGTRRVARNNQPLEDQAKQALTLLVVTQGRQALYRSRG